MRSATLFNRLCFSAVVLLWASLLWGQVPSGYSCLDGVNVSADENCQYVIDPNSLLTGGPPLQNLKVFVFDNQTSNREIADCPGTYTYSITTENNAVICWGNITLEDKTAPVMVESIQTRDTLECAQIDKILNNPLTIAPTVDGESNPYYLGEVVFYENCTSCNCPLNRKFFDQVDFFACDSLPYFAKITRKWTATDCNNLSTESSQYFYLIRPSFDSLNLVEDINVSTCNPDTIEIGNYFPYWIDTFGDTLFVNELDCNYDALIEEFRVETCDSNVVFIDRYVKVFDWCNGESEYVDTFSIRLGDFDAPVFSGNAKSIDPANILNQLNNEVSRDSILNLFAEGKISQISTGPMDCTIGFSTELDALKNQFAFDLADCQMVDINTNFYTFGPNEIFDIPLGDSIWRLNNFNTFINNAGRMVSGIPQGLHAMVITADDGCFGQSTGVIFFSVADQIDPIAICNDELSISLSINNSPNPFIGAYAKLDVEDIDEGSSDNCMLDQLLIRRTVDLGTCSSFYLDAGYDSNRDGQIDENDFFDTNNNGIQDSGEYNWEFLEGQWRTPWNGFVEFFCCDVDQNIRIELLAVDAAFNPITGEDASNSSTCWLNVVVEDPSSPQLIPLPSVELDCSASILSLLQDGLYTDQEDVALLTEFQEALGASSILNSPCGGAQLSERITRDLDDCGFGKIYRTVIVERTSVQKGYQVDSITQEINVKESYDYWIKFPKDIFTNCTEDLIDTLLIETTQNNCDLLAISHQDEYFFAPQEPGACFKIFRTIKVINWCEYDGISEPVLVSRDWDTWNGYDCDNNYNVNPLRPDGNNQPGDSDLYVIVKRNFFDNAPDTVYYDQDSNPYNSFPDNPDTDNLVEAYWWKVISGTGSPEDPAYFQDPIACDNLNPNNNNGFLPNVWNNDPNNNGSQDDDDIRYGSIGYWQYTQHLIVYDDQFPSVIFEGEQFVCANDPLSCTGNVSLRIILEDQCVGSGNIDAEVFLDIGDEGKFVEDYTFALTDSLFEADIPIGRHKLIVKADDNCGNVINQSISIEVRDCKAPAPICSDGIIVELAPLEEGGASANVWATDFIQSSIFDCSGQGPDSQDGLLEITEYSINFVDAPVNREQASIILDCALADSILFVEIHAWDENNLHDYCRTFVSIQDNQDYCNPEATGMIAGNIFMEDTRTVQNVEVQLSGAMDMLYPSAEDGSYAFENVEEYGDYSIQPYLNSNAKNGISTFDILLIQKHILGNDPLKSPYKIIAADVNNSGAVSTLDMIALRKLILNIDLSFANNTSWRFVDANYAFPNADNPWLEVFPEIININNLQDTIHDVDFVAIKVGDISGNVDIRNGVGLEERSAHSTPLYYSDQVLQMGATHEIPLHLNREKVEGLQMAIRLPRKLAKITGISSDFVKDYHYRIDHERNVLLLSWINEEQFDFSKGQEFLRIQVEAQKQSQTREILTLAESIMPAELYANSDINYLELREMEILGDEVSVQASFPNPFKAQTRIPFFLPEATMVQMEVIDQNGKIIKRIHQSFESGQHTIQLTASDFPHSGIYFFRFRANGIEQTNRLIYF